MVSKDWSKWLKIGFSAIKVSSSHSHVIRPNTSLPLLQLSTCVLELGMGNPLGIASAGVDAVKEIYGAYKSKSDKDFNTYIREPFLTYT